MIISFRYRFSIDQILFALSCFSWILSIAALFGFLIAIWNIKPSISPCLPKSETLSLPKDFSAIGTGPLSLCNDSRSLLARYLEHKIILLGHSSRPDMKNGEKFFAVGIKGTDQKQIFKEGEKVFLNICTHPSGGIDSISFSPNETSTWFNALSHKGGKLLLHFSQNEQQEGELFLQQNAHGEISQERIALIQLFKEARIWGKDKFFQQYGAKEYRQSGEKFKFEISPEKKRKFFFVGPNDYLTYANENWIATSRIDDINKEGPLAQIRCIGSSLFEVELWDEKGFSIFHGQIKEENIPPQHFAIEQVLLTPKLRTAKQMTCFIGKKRVLLKEGDWLMKTKNGWRTLKTSTDIEAYLNHSLMGEILIFDGLEVKNGQYFLKGHWFNELHTNMQSLMFPINSEKKAKAKKKG